MQSLDHAVLLREADNPVEDRKKKEGVLELALPALFDGAGSWARFGLLLPPSQHEEPVEQCRENSLLTILLPVESGAESRKS